MTVEEKVLQTLRELPTDKQKIVLDFIESLRMTDESQKPLTGFIGLLEQYNVRITEEDIAEARREMWGNFPRALEP